MSHRRQHVVGRGKGGHEHKAIRQRRADGPVKPVVSNRKNGKEMKYTNSIQEGAAGFGRLVRWSIAGAIIAAILSVSMCASVAASAQSFAAPFHLKVSPESVTASHAVARVSLDSALTIRVGRAVHTSKVQGIEQREGGTMYILTDGVCHYRKESAGVMLVWMAGGFNWIFYDFIPGEVTTRTKQN